MGIHDEDLYAVYQKNDYELLYLGFLIEIDKDGSGRCKVSPIDNKSISHTCKSVDDAFEFCYKIKQQNDGRI